VNDPDGRKILLAKPKHPFHCPAISPFLAATTDRAQAKTGCFISETNQAGISGHGIVVQAPLHDPAQPSPGFTKRLMPAFSQRQFNSL
jgi:hypothetical protein